MIHENFHTKHSVFTAPDVHMHTSLLYIMSIQPVNKAAKHLINSTPVMEKKEVVNAYLIKNSKVWDWWGGGGVLSQAVGRIGRSIMSQFILCYNYFKVCRKLTFEGAK